MTFEKPSQSISTTDQLRAKVKADRIAARLMLDAQFAHLFDLMALTLTELNVSKTPANKGAIKAKGQKKK